MATSRRGRRMLSHDDLAEISGLHKATIQRLSLLTSWRGVTVDTMERFSSACGVNLLQTGKGMEILRTRKMVFFHHANREQRRFLSRVLALAHTVISVPGRSSGLDASGESQVASINSSREAMKIG